MTKTEDLIKIIVKAIQDKKGEKITIVDMRKLEAPCRVFVICEGNSNIQMTSINKNIFTFVLNQANEKPIGGDINKDSKWQIMDYGDIVVHIFEKETRKYYDLEHLWSDAILTDIPALE